jgi:hypothetical protein
LLNAVLRWGAGTVKPVSLNMAAKKNFAGADALAAQFEFWPALKIAR